MFEVGRTFRHLLITVIHSRCAETRGTCRSGPDGGSLVRLWNRTQDRPSVSHQRRERNTASEMRSSTRNRALPRNEPSHPATSHQVLRIPCNQSRVPTPTPSTSHARAWYREE